MNFDFELTLPEDAATIDTALNSPRKGSALKEDHMFATHSDDDYLPPLLRALASLDTAAAIRELAAAANAHPGDPRPLVLLAAEYAQAKAIDQAEATYIAALQCSPDYLIARFQLGLLQFTSGRPATASATWAALSDLPENHEYRLFKAGLECLAQDRFDEAAHYLQLGIAANVANPPLNQDMRRLLDEIAKVKPQADARAPDAAAEKGRADEVATEHFLVSAYRNLH